MDELRARLELSRKIKSRSFDTTLVAPGSRRKESGRSGERRKKMGKEKVPGAGIIRPIMLPHLEKRTVRFPAAFARKQGTQVVQVLLAGQQHLP